LRNLIKIIEVRKASSYEP